MEYLYFHWVSKNTFAKKIPQKTNIEHNSLKYNK
jgi:hypothetical protein